MTEARTPINLAEIVRPAKAATAAKVFDSVRFAAVSLYTREGRYVATIGTLPWANDDAWPDVILWGSRAFVRDDFGMYREGFAWVATMGLVPDSKVQSTRDLGAEPTP